MGRMSFLSRRYTPPTREDQRLREMEKYLGRQSEELYIWLTCMEKRVEVLEKKLSEAETEQNTAS